MIYLDYAANAPMEQAALEAFLRAEQRFVGNPNAAHAAGQAARAELARVTERIAAHLGVSAADLIYTSGATEANNLAVKGLTAAGRGRHIITTPLEHPSVRVPLERLKEQGYEISVLDLRADGTLDLAQLSALLREDTALVAVCAADSELGVPQPIGEISALLRVYPECRLHVDATQLIGRQPFSFDGADTVSLSGHKLGGPNGIGLLYKRSRTPLCPQMHGGAGASPYRSGTPTLALACALEAALGTAIAEMSERSETVRALNARLRRALGSDARIRINSPVSALPHILNLSVKGISGTRMQRALSDRGVCVSVKSACSTSGAPSEAVLALTGDRRCALSAWRVSLSHRTTQAEIDRFLALLDACIRAL